MARSTPASTKTERLLNLVIALLYTRQPMSKARIRKAVPQYADSSDEAFDRMFERDKDELRDLGIPLRTETIDPLFDDEPGYRIDRREYALPEIEFATDELAVIGLASRAWSQASLAGAAAQALRKLETDGLTRDDASVAGFEPLLHTSAPAFEPVRNAVLNRQPITFDYRGSGGAGVTSRQVQPWVLTAWHGHWYLTGHDLGREAPRMFRVDRIVGAVRTQGRPGGYQVPEDHDPRAMITSSSSSAPVTGTVAVRKGAGHTLRRRATGVTEVDDRWDRLTVEADTGWGLVEEVASLGPDARLVEPAELAERVREALYAVAQAHGPAGEAGPARGAGEGSFTPEPGASDREGSLRSAGLSGNPIIRQEGQP
ncbi:helix-turn-helix transcriptional regulator [Ornithinicoccus hortensis]|uniref:Transcriptional regulator n=1 Tax=Ornithinicoccus hortensis TaxID=82346 RepID=A0A542YT17_9MICO|nr:WYL domain-containing protein [Ornithinicoccus hortensis]TQL51201.1 transcriptional regulator [Ornithinicoccus hortensis]